MLSLIIFVCVFLPPILLLKQNSQCVSGPSSMNTDFTGGSVCDHASSVNPAYMPSLQRGYEELGREQLERLQQEINNIKSNYRKANVSDCN